MSGQLPPWASLMAEDVVSERTAAHNAAVDECIHIVRWHGHIYTVPEMDERQKLIKALEGCKR